MRLTAIATGFRASLDSACEAEERYAKARRALEDAQFELDRAQLDLRWAHSSLRVYLGSELLPEMEEEEEGVRV